MTQRHPALQWMYAYIEEANSPSSKRIGAGTAWIRFAYDIHTISDNALLEAKLKERLTKYKSFQTSRHELWTAALFIALDNKLNIQIAVEAKCRQRKGVLGFKGGNDKPAGEDIGITSLLKKAYKKVEDIPLCIVVDTNLPPQTEKWNLEYWQVQIGDSLNELARNGYDNPCPANLILFYNDPSHYMASQEIGSKEDSLWLSDCYPAYPKNQCDHFDVFRQRLLKAQR